MLIRLIGGAAVALVIALLARRGHALSASGAAAAVVVGAIAAAAGWGWAALLIIYFVSTSALSRLPVAGSTAMERIVEKGGERDAWQVLANGGVFVVCLMAFIVGGSTLMLIAAAASLAAAAADSWATEIGSRYGGIPRSILSFREVPVGTSGAFSLGGLLAAWIAAGFVAVVARSLVGTPLLVVALAGFAGALLDTLLGAFVQDRRWCPHCSEWTERHVHVCGVATESRGGIRWLDNDAVNVACTVAGALIAVVLSSS